MKNKIEEIQRYLNKTEKALSEITNADTAGDLRDAWEDYLSSFSRTLGRLISSADANAKMRPWGHRLKNESNGGDEGLVFLREARNYTEHGVTPFADFQEKHVSIGPNLVAIENGTVQFKNCHFNGKSIENLTVHARDGKVAGIAGSGMVDIKEVPTNVRLRPIVSEEKRKTFPVPQSIGGQVLDEDSPVALATSGFEVLKYLVQDFENQCKSSGLL